MLRRLRLITGLIMFLLVTIHLINHAFGLVSLATLNAVEHTVMYYFQVGPQDTIVFWAALLHALLALQSIFARRSWRMPTWEATQIGLGLSIPFLLAEHFATTRRMFDQFGIDMNYPEILYIYWAVEPRLGLLQILLLCIVWAHGCIGVHFWLRLRPWYAALNLWPYTLALLLPILALLGFAEASKEVLWRAQDPDWLAANTRLARVIQNDGLTIAAGEALRVQLGWLALMLVTLLAGFAKSALEKRRRVVRLSYPDGRRITLPPGGTVLEASRAAGIGHASVCGGRARCSTCRVRVGKGAEFLPAPTDAEAKVLSRIGAPSVIRLACQLRPTADLEVAPLLPPNAGVRDGMGGLTHLLGEEREIAVLFADLRGFTKLSSEKLPFDVVFILNRYFAEMGDAVIQAGGRVDKFIGDGVMALFGIENGPKEGCRQALEAARAMGQRMERLNEALAHDLREPLSIGIGIHAGPAIVGTMGHDEARALTAIGDTVNVASRLETATKEFGAQLVFSAAVARYAGLAPGPLQSAAVAVRGKEEPVDILVARQARDLPPT